MIESTESTVWAPMYDQCEICGGLLVHQSGEVVCWSCGVSSVPDANGCNEMEHAIISTQFRACCNETSDVVRMTDLLHEVSVTSNQSTARPIKRGICAR